MMSTHIENNVDITCDMLMMPTASVLNPSMVLFLYFFRLCSMIWSWLPSRLRKWGYCREKLSSSSVSSSPLVGSNISLDRSVRFEL